MEKSRNWKKWALAAAVLAVPLAVVFGQIACLHGESDDDDKDILSSRSYQGHESDVDINLFVQAYPFVRGTRLDDCQTCHTGGEITTYELDGGTVYEDVDFKNACDFCHYVPFPLEPSATEWYAGQPHNYYQTLNPYGKAYMNSGRDWDAIWAINKRDSDGDTFSNNEEIRNLRYPGDPNSMPGQPLCPSILVSAAEIRALPAHTQFGLANATRQQFDMYETYTGVKIVDLLAANSVDLVGSTGVDIMAPDGFSKSFKVYEITDQFPDHQFFTGLGVTDLGNDCAFVEYPDETYGYADGDTIVNVGGNWHILAYKREGVNLDPSYLDPVSGKIGGEGPYRNVIPPGADDPLDNRPDRGEKIPIAGCTNPFGWWNYNKFADHNQGRMVKGAVIIKVNPMPAGCEEFDIHNGGWALVDSSKILIYGHGVAAP